MNQILTKETLLKMEFFYTLVRRLNYEHISLANDSNWFQYFSLNFKNQRVKSFRATEFSFTNGIPYTSTLNFTKDRYHD